MQWRLVGSAWIEVHQPFELLRALLSSPEKQYSIFRSDMHLPLVGTQTDIISADFLTLLSFHFFFCGEEALKRNRLRSRGQVTLTW